MFRQRAALLASSIPRSVWDPAHFNPNWSDSYSTSIADRRHWPAKKWSIGLEPKTPRDWLQFSYRNLAYAYNGALRACSTFPEMLVYYKEMKQRGVKVDLDTMNVLLTRAARYERIQVNDIFLLFDEMMTLGARPDIASVETLHTVWEHSAGMPREWREARRLQLVELYNHLAQEEIVRLGPQKVSHLLAAQMQRYRDNLKQMGASLSPSVYRMYFPQIESAELLLREVHNFLWEFVETDHPAMEIPSLQFRIPFVASVLKRPPADSNPSSVKFVDFEDADLCSVFLAAVERLVDGPFTDRRPITERRVYLSLLTMITASGVLYSSDLIAQLMDIVKYSTQDDSRDADAQRLLRHAVRGSSASQDRELRALWQTVSPVADARVVGRYIAARDPWSTDRICFDERGVFKSYPVQQLLGAGVAEGSAELVVTEDAGSGESVVQPKGGRRQVQRTVLSVEDVDLRWADIKRLVEVTGALTKASDPERHSAPQMMEVFTGQAVFLRHLVTGARYGDPVDAGARMRGNSTSRLFSPSLGADVFARILTFAEEVHADMEKFMSENPGTEPELECWEALLIVLRSILDFCVVSNQQKGSGSSSELFSRAAKMRETLVEESRNRFGGRMKILWLQES